MSPRLPVPLRAYLLATAGLELAAKRLLRRRLAAGKEDPARIGERLGRPSVARPDGVLVWFHAASVGESLALLPLIARLGTERPALNVLVTTGTLTSARLMTDRLPPGATHQFVPLDTPRAVRGFLDHWRPDLAAWSESELWPRLIVETHDRAVPMLLLNARMAERSVARWRMAPRTAASLLGRFDLALAQEAHGAKALETLGFPTGRLRVTGSLKRSADPPTCDGAELERLQGAVSGRAVWLAASTHPGEEALAADAHARVLARHPDALLIVVPRHPERGGEVAGRLGGFTLARRTSDETPAPTTQILLADTLGEMGLWYRLAPISFVGGSFGGIGGHNPFEPLSLGSAVVHGPDTANFDEIYRTLDAGGGAIPVASAEDLAASVLDLQTAARRESVLASARRIVEGEGDAVAAAAHAILSRLPHQPDTPPFGPRS